MADIEDDALLLRSIPYSDSSLILHCLTPTHGRISLMARGARRAKSPFRASLMPLHHLKIRWRAPRTGSLNTLLEVQRLKPLLQENKMLDGQTLLAKASTLFPDGVDQGYKELWNALHTLSNWPQSSGLAASLWGMMDESGWVGDFEHCWQCSTHIEFSHVMFWHQANLLCLECSQKQGIELSSGCRKSLKAHAHQTNIVLSQTNITTWMRMINDCFQAHR